MNECPTANTEKLDDFPSLPELPAHQITIERELTRENFQLILNPKRIQREPGDDVKRPLYSHVPLSPSEERLVIRAARAGDQAAMQKLMVSYHPLLNAIAELLSDRPSIQAELIQEGMLNIWEALQKYDETSGTRLIRFASRSLAYRMLTHMEQYDDTTTLDLKSTAREKCRAVEDMRSQGVPRDKIKNSLGLGRYGSDHVLSQLEHMLAGDIETDIEANPNLADENGTNPEESLQIAENIAHIRHALETDYLSRDQKNVLCCLYGIAHPEYNRSGKKVGITKLPEFLSCGEYQIEKLYTSALSALQKYFAELEGEPEAPEEAPEGEIPASPYRTKSNIDPWENVMLKHLKLTLSKWDANIYDELVHEGWSAKALQDKIDALTIYKEELWARMHSRLRSDTDFMEYNTASGTVRLLQTILKKKFSLKTSAPSQT